MLSVRWCGRRGQSLIGVHFIQRPIRAGRGSPSAVKHKQWSGLICFLVLFAAGNSAAAETGWVRGEVRLNVRTGPGTEYRIVGVLKTGDSVSVLSRGENWTEVETQQSDGLKRGWIPEGYLRAQPPPSVRLGQAEARVVELGTTLATVQKEAEQLRNAHADLASQDGAQQAQIKELTMENMELKAGARYPEWITGAAIFAAGMVLGAWIHRNSARRQPARIRL